jgi:phospholipid transport system substrate-binding protein
MFPCGQANRTGVGAVPMRAKLIQWIFGAILACIASVSFAEKDAGKARATVDDLHRALIEVMKNADRLGYAGRYEKLEPVVRKSFNFEAVSQVSLGGHWNKLTREQKKAFIEKLTRLSLATYASQFNGYGGERFEFEGVDSASAGRAMLTYFLTAPKEKPIKFQYILIEFRGRWEIVNIIVDGISDLALRKAQYTSIIDREGYDALMGKLDEKISDYAK